MKCPKCDQEIGSDMLINLVNRRNPPKVATGGGGRAGGGRRSPPDIWALCCPQCEVVLQFVA